VSLLFDFIERSESPRLINVMKMQSYKLLARILLILSVINFALATPVVVQEHEPANAADQTNAPPIPRSSDAGNWYNLRSRTDSIGSPEPSNPANNPPSLSPPPGPGSTPSSPTSQAPTDETNTLNPSSPHGNADLNTSLYQSQGPTDNSDR
jgi:hypothetical protein